MLVLYMNDVLPTSDVESLLEGDRSPDLASYWRPRLSYLLEWRDRGYVPRRWHRPPDADQLGLRKAIYDRLADDDLRLERKIDRFVDPELAAAIRAGLLSPGAANLLWRNDRSLRKKVDLGPQLAAFHRYAEEHSARLSVSYIPSLNQVSTAYLATQARLSRPIRAESLTGERFQRHARDLDRACSELGIPFLDLTPALRRAESEGRRLYHAHEGHMNGDGYRVVAHQLFDRLFADLEPPGG